VRSRERDLEAPHKRISGPARLIERTAVVAYRASSAVMARIPPALSRPVLATVVQGAYLLWPTKRRWSNANFGHVLGLPPDHPQVRRFALKAYRTYARYLVELMRLPSGRDRIELELEGVDDVEAAWRASGGPLILSVAHIGNNEAAATALAERGYPINVIADDTAFPELFALLKEQRHSWGVELIPWRNLRDIYGVLRKGEILGVVVDWGYRADGIPVRLFDAWTTLPAGAATLAAKTGAWIIPVALRRTGPGRFRMDLDQPIIVSSLEPAELQRGTQAIADALQRTVAQAPDQWYSFKPMWPLDPAEQAVLEQRARDMQAGVGRRRRGRVAADATDAGAATVDADRAGNAAAMSGSPEAATT
jgi:phosphatidylinositol dimannoside acyltransferase